MGRYALWAAALLGLLLFFDARVRRRAVLALGAPAEASVTEVSRDQVTLRYELRPGFAVTQTLACRGAADRIAPGQKLRLRYLSRLPHVAALEDDGGAAARDSLRFLLALFLVAALLAAPRLARL